LAPSKVNLVAVVGAESTGKTTLCQALARTMGGLTFAEPLRQWVLHQGRAPTQDEQAQVLVMQRQAEAEATARAQSTGLRWVFCDSSPLVTAAYSQYYFNDVSLFEDALSHHQSCYTATLFCTPDGVPWTPDPGQRDGPDARERVNLLIDCWVRQLRFDHPRLVLYRHTNARLIHSLQFIRAQDLQRFT
jgi:nicotinamide riboside kinase